MSVEAEASVSRSIEHTVRAVVARYKKGWSILPRTITVDGDTATVQIKLLLRTKAICISLTKETIEWEQR